MYHKIIGGKKSKGQRNINKIKKAINTYIDKFIKQDFAEDFRKLVEEITNDIERIKGKI